MARRVISSGSEWEARFGYSRAVVVGRHVHIGGTAPQMPHGGLPWPDPYDQARRCLEIIGAALQEAGATAQDVVRTRLYITDRGNIEAVMRAHGEFFAETRPACTAVVVELLDPSWLVEIEADAILPA
jgi:enamine deaminase RidA (YjgF/YER057c/UK114 family)